MNGARWKPGVGWCAPQWGATLHGGVAGFGVKGISHRIGQHVGADDQAKHEQKGTRKRPPNDRRGRQFLARSVDHDPKTRCVGVHANAHIRKHGFRQDKTRELHHTVDEHQVHQIGGDVGKQNAHATHPKSLSGLDVVEFSQFHGLASDQTT